MSEYIVQPRIYIVIFLSLMLGTGLTVLAAFYDFPGPLNAIVAMTIAVIKASLVILFFMHVRYSGRLIWLVITAALLWMAILFAITFSDYWTRLWLPAF
jgi:cytochrome c oxidase subunit IV